MLILRLTLISIVVYLNFLQSNKAEQNSGSGEGISVKLTLPGITGTGRSHLVCPSEKIRLECVAHGVGAGNQLKWFLSKDKLIDDALISKLLGTNGEIGKINNNSFSSYLEYETKNKGIQNIKCSVLDPNSKAIKSEEIEIRSKYIYYR